jgi:hypothetical protein
MNSRKDWRCSITADIRKPSRDSRKRRISIQTSAEPIFTWGVPNIGLNSWRQALTPLRTAYRLSPEETKREALDLLVDALFAESLNAFKTGDFETSVEYLKELLGLQPTYAKARTES